MILHKASYIIQDRRIGHNTVPKCASGRELIDWIMNLSPLIHTRSQAASMWQVLIEEGALFHGNIFKFSI